MVMCVCGGGRGGTCDCFTCADLFEWVDGRLEKGGGWMTASHAQTSFETAILKPRSYYSAA